MVGDEVRAPFWSRHRGPYRLVVCRPHRIKARAARGFSTTEWLPGEIRHGEDVVGEAWALLDDPRDTIEVVSVWSVHEQAFVGGYRKGDTRDG